MTALCFFILVTLLISSSFVAGAVYGREAEAKRIAKAKS